MKKNQIFSSYLSAGKLCGKNVAEMWHFRLESATLGENRQQWTKKNGNPSLSSDSRNFGKKMVDHFFIFQKNSLHLKMANFSSLKRRSIFTSRKILREKLELHSASKKSLNIAKMVEKRFELPTSTHDLSYEKIRLADCHKIPIFF